VGLAFLAVMLSLFFVSSALDCLDPFLASLPALRISLV